MSQVTSTQSKTMTVVVAPQPESELMFSEEFMSMVQDRAYETLRAYLERTKQDGAVELLDDLIILSMRAYGTADAVVKNMFLSEAVGLASRHVLSLGGTWGK